MSTEIRKHPNALSQEALERAVAAFEERTSKKPAGGVVVFYADYEQRGALKLGVMARVGDHFSFGGNYEHQPDEPWRGHAEVAWAW